MTDGAGPASGKGPGLFSAAYRQVVLALLAGVGLVSYNNMAATAALPDIGEDLGSVALLPWVVTVELLASAIAVLAVGPYIDGSGASRTFRITIVGFAAASFLCAAAPTMELLVVARVLQGLGTGALLGTAITSIGLISDDRIRPRIYAVVSAMWGVMSVGGPALAAGLVGTLGWRAVFAVNLPVAAAAGAIGWRRLPEQAAADPERLDRRGLLLAGAVTTALLGASSGIEWWSLGLLAAAAALTAAYVRHARSHPAPVVRVAHIAGARWRSLHTTASLILAGGTGAAVFLPLYLRGSRGASTAAAAFSVVWLALGWGFSSWAASKLQERLSSETVILMGAVLQTAAIFGLAGAVSARAPVPVVAVGFCVVGCGIGSVAVSALNLLQHRASEHEMGRISAAHQFIRTLGFTYGAAVAGLVLFAVVGWRIGDVEAVRDLLSRSDAPLSLAVAQALESGFAWALAATAALSVLGLPTAAALVRTRERPPRL